MAEGDSTSHPTANLTSPNQCSEISETCSKPKKKRRSESQNDDTIQGPPAKAKQSKSRNGCLTCKAKRLKCDEIKPTCEQCAKRGVECGGYKKELKWKPFEEQPVFLRTALAERKKDSTASLNATASSSFRTAVPRSTQPAPSDHTVIIPSTSRSTSGSSSLADEVTITPILDTPPSSEEPSRSGSHSPGNDQDDKAEFQSTDLDWPEFDENFLQSDANFSNEETSFPTPESLQKFLGVDNFTDQVGLEDGKEIESTQQPLKISSASQQSKTMLARLDGFDVWDESDAFSLTQNDNVFPRLTQQPQSIFESPRWLMAYFNSTTCGIMSIKDGPTENPWRNLVWPLAQNSTIAFHAVASMVCFHLSKAVPNLRNQGMYHHHTCMKLLRDNLDSLETDTALAVTLALAFSESWDTHVSTGIDHIKGGRQLITKALAEVKDRDRTPLEWTRLRFLCRTWIYVDVIARLTSVDDDYSDFFDHVEMAMRDPDEIGSDIDPLMGCASTLFPIVGRVANLVRRVCQKQKTTPAIITEGIQLKAALENWHPPELLWRPEDPSLTAAHSFHTAHAYRWATLLYLHHAVPEIPSMESGQLAELTLNNIALVPLTSPAVIVQIYPLLAAGSEVSSSEDRQWVQDRWEGMSQRMSIGNIDRCADVVREVWRRRDARQEAMSDNLPSLDNVAEPGQDNLRLGKNNPNIFNIPVDSSQSAVNQGFGKIDFDSTVHGKLHWVGVMKDWNWEVLLG